MSRRKSADPTARHSRVAPACAFNLLQRSTRAVYCGTKRELRACGAKTPFRDGDHRSHFFWTLDLSGRQAKSSGLKGMGICGRASPQDHHGRHLARDRRTPPHRAAGQLGSDQGAATLPRLHSTLWVAYRSNMLDPALSQKYLRSSRLVTVRKHDVLSLPRFVKIDLCNYCALGR